MQTYLEQELSDLKESQKKLRKENEIKQKRIEILEHNVEALTQALLQAAKQRFGASSEKTPYGDGQLYLFEGEKELPLEEKAETHTVKAHARLKRKSGDKARLIADIPREVVECVLNAEEVCDVCSSSLQVIGKKSVRTELEYIPAKIKVIEYIQHIFKCSTCGTTDDYPDAVFKKAPVPAPVMQRSLASATSVAWIMYQKYAMAVPLYRQEKESRSSVARADMEHWQFPSTVRRRNGYVWA